MSILFQRKLKYCADAFLFFVILTPFSWSSEQTAYDKINALGFSTLTKTSTLLPYFEVHDLYFSKNFAQWIGVRHHIPRPSDSYVNRVLKKNSGEFIYISENKNSKKTVSLYYFIGLTEKDVEAFISNFQQSGTSIHLRPGNWIAPSAYAQSDNEDINKILRQFENSEASETLPSREEQLAKLTSEERNKYDHFVNSYHDLLEKKSTNSGQICVDPNATSRSSQDEFFLGLKKISLNITNPLNGDCWQGKLDALKNIFTAPWETLQLLGKEGAGFIDFLYKNPSYFASLGTQHGQLTTLMAYFKPRIDQFSENLKVFFNHIETIFPGVSKLVERQIATDPNGVTKLLCGISAEVGIDVVFSLLVPGGASKLATKLPIVQKMMEGSGVFGKLVKNLSELKPFIQKYTNHFDDLLGQILTKKDIPKDLDRYTSHMLNAYRADAPELASFYGSCGLLGAAKAVSLTKDLPRGSSKKCSILSEFGDSLSNFNSKFKGLSQDSSRPRHLLTESGDRAWTKHVSMSEDDLRKRAIHEGHDSTRFHRSSVANMELKKVPGHLSDILKNHPNTADGFFKNRNSRLNIRKCYQNGDLGLGYKPNGSTIGKLNCVLIVLINRSDGVKVHTMFPYKGTGSEPPKLLL